jgi:alpha-2-macroglobulin
MKTAKLLLIALVLTGFALPSLLADEGALKEARARAALADRDYGRAVALFGELVEKHPDDPRTDYRAMMGVRALTLAEDTERAVEAGEAFLMAYPKSRYFDKVAFFTAENLLLTGRGAEGTELMAAAVKRLSGPELRTAIADYYLTAADKAFAGVAPVGPFDQGTPPNFARALKLYGLARSSGIPAAKKGEVLLRYARAALETKGYDLAIGVLEERAKDPALAADPNALLLLGRCYLARKMTAGAQDVLSRIALEFAGQPQAAEALFLLNNPASLERLVREYPNHPRAPEAAYRRGDLLVGLGHVDRAVAAYLDTASRYPDSPFAPKAIFQAAGTLLAAKRYDEARTRYDEFLRRFPENARWATARDHLTDAWYKVGSELADRGKLKEAAEVWVGLRTKYPLSKEAPRSLLAEAGHRSGGSSLKLLRELLARYPKSEQAPSGALKIAAIFAEKSGSAAEAVSAYRQVVSLYPGTSAARTANQRLKAMQEEAITLELERVVVPGRPMALKVSTRNLERVSGRVYRIDPVSYFKKHGNLARVENVMVEVMAPDAVFEHQVLDYEKFRMIEGEMPVPVEGAGAYIVVVEGGKLKATCLLLVSDLNVITKESPKGLLSFVTDARSGEPVKGAKVVVRRIGGEVALGQTKGDGVARFDAAEKSGAGVLAVRGDSVALAGYSPRSVTVKGLQTTVHIATDRPVYRPGHEVKFRAVVRRAAGDFFETPAGERALVTVADRAGNPLYRLDTTLSEFGTVAGAFELPADLPPHTYTIELRYRDRKFNGNFKVEAYRKPQMFLSATPRRPVYIRGETVEIEIRARYSFGRPMAGLDIEAVINAVGIESFAKRREVLTTDENGVALVTVPTGPGADATLRVMAQVRDVTRRLYYAEAGVPVMNTGYRASLSAKRQGYYSGEFATVKLLTMDALGNPVAAKGKIEVGHYPDLHGTPVWSLVTTLPVETDETGKTFIEHKLGNKGQYRFFFRGEDRTGREVNAEATFRAASRADQLIVRIDQPEHFVGDRMGVKVISPEPGSFALVTIEGEEIYDYLVAKLTATETDFEFKVNRRHVPNVWVAAAMVAKGGLYKGIDQVTVHERIRLTVKPEKAEYAPGEFCRLLIKTVDDAGNPIPAEVALAVVDEGLFLIEADRTPDMVAHFRPRERQHLVRTDASTGFSYDGKTSEISNDLLAERERRMAEPATDPSVMLEEKSLDKKNDDFDGPDTNSAIGIGGGAGGAFGGRGGHRNLKAMGGGSRTAGAESMFAPRQRFEDTAYFKADVITGSDGTATVEFILPDDLTEWRITARGASHGNAFGTGLASLLTTRPLVIRAALPRFFREGDRLIAGAGVVNGTPTDVDVKVTLSPAAEMEAVSAKLSVPANAERLVNWPLPDMALGEVLFTARAMLATGAEDSEQRTIPVLAYGVPWRDGYGASTFDPAERTLTLPEDFVPGTVEVTIFAPRNLARSLLESVGELRSFPYGCTEQTVNRFYPALEIAKAVRDLGLDKAAMLPELEKVARAGALRLTYLQNNEGLWGWWQKGQTNAEMTAYALIGLAAARDSGIEISKTVFEKAKKGLPALEKRTADPDERAFLQLARARAFGTDLATLAPTYADRGRLKLKGLAFLALAYEPFGGTAQHRILTGEIAKRLTDSADTESLGFALTALAFPGTPVNGIRAAETALLSRRVGRGFGTTRETGAVVAGLARLAALPPFDGPESGGPVTVTVNGEKLQLVRSERMTVPAEKLTAGANRIRVAGVERHSVLLSCVRKKAPKAVGPLEVARQLSLVPSSGAIRDAVIVRSGSVVVEPVVERLRIGETVRVTLTVATGGERYLVVEDPIPAGFEPVPGTEVGPFVEKMRLDDRMVFFLENPAAEVKLSYFVQSEALGTVRVPPAVIYAMYRPNASAFSGEDDLSVADANEPIDRDVTLGYGASDLRIAAIAAFEAGRHEEAAALIETLLTRYQLRDVYVIEALRFLAQSRVALGDHAAAIAAYERLIAEVPSFRTERRDEELRAASFAALSRYGEAMGALSRITFDLFEIDRRVPIEIGGENARAIEADLLDRYPSTQYTERAYHSLADRTALDFERRMGAGIKADPALLEPLSEYLARFPEAHAAPQVAFRLMRTRLRAGKWVELEEQARRFGDRYPGSTFLDDADWYVAFSLFAQGRLDEAEQFALTSLAAVYPLEDGGKGKTSFEKNLVHLMAQVAHVKGRLDEAARLYEQVAEFTVDAREALRELNEVRLSAPAVVRVGTAEPVAFNVTVKNLAVVTYEVYPIDLLVYFTLRKDVEQVAGLNLDGLLPLKSATIALPDENLRQELSPLVDLGRMDPGVYLVITRAGSREERGLVIVSDLNAELRPNADGARVLVTHRETGAPIPGAFVKIAQGGTLIHEGRTDPRGIIEVRGTFEGKLTAVAEKDGSYALAK